MRLKGSIALVTGSSRGIGKAIAIALAREGASVVINASRSAAEARRTLASFEAASWQAHRFIRADMGRPRDIARMMNEIRRSYGRLDILVNNAGTTKFIDHRRLEALTPEIFDEIYRINLRGPFLVVRAGLPLLMRSRAPLVVNIASIAALTAVGSNIAYCASKAALVNMTMSLARALAPKIRVNAISPGLTETGLMKGWKAYKAEQLKKTPLKRLATGDDIANVVIALATSLSYITGENIIVDGGRVLNC